MRVLSPMPTGSGAIVVHRQIEALLPQYSVVPYNPWWTLAPPVLRLIARQKADIIHTSPDYAIFVTPRKTPLVATLHNYVLDDYMRPYSTPLQALHYRTDLRLFTRLALQRATVITAVSRFTADLARRDLGLKRPVRVIANGIDAARFTPARRARAGDTLRVLFSGNLTLRKGANLLPAIAAALAPGIEIVCAAGLSARQYAGTAEKEIRILGHVRHSEMPALYREVDVLLMPTVREGLSLAVLEAMATGLPIVATRCSSLPELVHEGRGGFLCAPGNAVEFAEKIKILASAPELRRQMGEYNRARIETSYTLDAMINSYRSLFEEVMDTRAPA